MDIKEEQKAEEQPVNSVKEEQKPDEHMIPKSRFDEVNTKAKELETRLAAIEAEKEAQTKKEMEEKAQFKELYESERAEKTKLALEVTKRDLIQQAVQNKELDPLFSHMIIGNNEEEIKQSLANATEYYKKVSEQLKSDTKASDNSGGYAPARPLSPEEQLAKDLAGNLPPGFKTTL